jgi:hypothetical protein
MNTPIPTFKFEKNKFNMIVNFGNYFFDLNIGLFVSVYYILYI